MSHSTETNAIRSLFGPPEIPHEDVTWNIMIARCRGLEVASKVLLHQKMTEIQHSSFIDEMRMCCSITHPNIIAFLGACVEPDWYQVVMERCQTNLSNLLSDPSYNGTLYDRLKLALDIAQGMSYLHERNLVHGNLTPDNCLIDFHSKVKITDFGLHQFRPAINTEFRSLLYTAPECLLKAASNEKADVYSFGIILWEILTRQRAFAHHRDKEQFCTAVCVDHERPLLPQDIPVALTELLENSWQTNPEHRYSFHQIVEKLCFVLVDLNIEVPIAATFWKTNFRKESFESVDWHEFLEAIRGVAGNFSDDFFEPFQDLIVSKLSIGGIMKLIVSVKQFDTVVKWFGPFFLKEHASAIFKEISSLMSERWFHSTISGEKAMSLLADKPSGTFLIRLSFSNPKNAPFTLSLPGNRHVHVKRTPNGFQVQDTVYSSLQNFVDANKATLKTPCQKKATPRYVQ